MGPRFRGCAASRRPPANGSDPSGVVIGHLTVLRSPLRPAGPPLLPFFRSASPRDREYTGATSEIPSCPAYPSSLSC